MKFGAAAVVLAVLTVAAASFVANSPLLSPGSVRTGQESLLVVRLTDPPHVPTGTTSLNLTFSSISLLVAVPLESHGFYLNQVNITASVWSSTVDLIGLENVSQTIAAANLTDGSVVYSATFTVTGIKIEINGTLYPVSLASGGSLFSVVIAGERELHGTNTALLQLNPVVVDTPSGYKLIPSSVGVIRGADGEDHVGLRHSLSGDEERDLEGASASFTFELVSFAVEGNVTSFSVQVNNTGSEFFTLHAIGIHGNLSAPVSRCSQESDMSDNGSGHVNETVIPFSGHGCGDEEGRGTVVFVPAGTPSGTLGCKTAPLQQLDGDSGEDMGIVVPAKDCVIVTFRGVIVHGDAHRAVVPWSASGLHYGWQVIGSKGAEAKFSCVLPAGPAACHVLRDSE